MIKPQRLKRGDKAAVVSLSKGLLGEDMFIHKFHMAKKRLMDDYGIELVPMENSLKGISYLYEHPEKRAEDMMNAFKDKSIKAVFCAIGGDDAIRLLPYVDFDVIKNNPKIFAGFSDSTTNHFMLYKAGLVSYYGISLMNNISEYVDINPYTRKSFEDMLIYPKEETLIPASDFLSYDKDKIWWGEEHINEETPKFPAKGYEFLQGEGKIEGQLLGGCVDVFTELLGTSLWPSLDEWRGKILLLETSENNMPDEILTCYLRNLQAQGIFDVIKGIVVGRPAFPEREESYKEVYKNVVGFESGHSELPIVFDVNVGHAYPVGVLPLGLKYEIDCDKKTFKLMEAPVL